jgi:hypothetical protein
MHDHPQRGRGQEGTGVVSDFIHVVQGIVALAFLWGFTLHAVNEVSTLLAGSATALPLIGALGLGLRITCGWVLRCHPAVLRNRRDHVRGP